ncbi:hypothetical protein [Lysobacter enzymogenes]|uniref:Lipoprotein n=1 Tax=Lysobacter enzymogenes TaxID=69 RepID=A0AAU9AMA4_LYSEN|nr:hypothetical protein [Lysobacter enzymogenes]BAV98449.1 conserved hypothetical protein [Lysobacter enzymogenes]
MNRGLFQSARVRGALLAMSIAALSGCGAADAPQAAPKAASAPAKASAPAAPAFDFEAWVAANASCQGDYIADLQDAQFAQRLLASGVRVSEDSGIGEIGVGGGTLTPDKPIRLHGFPVKQVTYYYDSGAMFAVLVEADAAQARAAVGAKPLPQVYRPDYQDGVPTAAASEDVPMPDIQFVRPGKQPGTQEIGCVGFDG